MPAADSNGLALREQIAQADTNKDRKILNPVWGVLFVLQIVYSLYITVFTADSGAAQATDGIGYAIWPKGDFQEAKDLREGLTFAYTAAVIVPAIISLIFVALIELYPGLVVTVVYASTFAMFGYMAMVSEDGTPFLIAIALYALFLYIIRKRIKIAVTLLGIAAKALSDNKGVMLVGLMSIIPAVLNMILFLLVLIARAVGDSLSFNTFVFSLGLYYWTGAFIKLVVHNTAAGAISTWYFFNKTSGSTMTGLKRALGSSFGAIALGSLVITMIKVFDFLLSISLVKRCCCCIGKILRRLVNMYSAYSFVYVAVFNKAYGPACKETANLFVRSGLDALASDGITRAVVDMVAFLGAVGGAAASYFSINTALKENWPEWAGLVAFMYGVFFYLLCYQLTTLLMFPLVSSITTVLVCWAEDPASFADSHPQDFANLRDVLVANYPELESKYAAVTAPATTA